MGKFRLTPLEKNNYFYGKLLTVRDFKSEQEYYMNKSQLVNRMLYGTGVVSGLKTTMIDAQTLSVESGFAIDEVGREIIVERPITKKLAVIEGFSTYKDAHQLYLCLEYDEKGGERIHSISNEDNHSSSLSDYNRIKESYKLTLVDEPDTQVKRSKVSYNERQAIILENSKLNIQLRYPDKVNPGEIFYVEMILNKKQVHLDVEVNLALNSKMAEPFSENKDNIIRFKEPVENRKPSYSTRIWMIASNQLEEKAKFEIAYDQSKVLLDQSKVPLLENIEMNFSIVNGDLLEINESKRKNMTLQEYLDNAALDRIYLARINLLKTGDVYQIQYVESLPYNQYVYDQNYVYDMLKHLSKSDRFNVSTKVSITETSPESKPEISVNYKNETKEFEFDFNLPQNQLIYDNIVTGLYTFEINENFKFGKNFVSEELNHGLGKGAAYIQVGLSEVYDGLNDSESSCVYYGASEVFYKTDFEPDTNSFSFGTVLYPNNGSFRIGMRLQSGKKGDEVKVRWWAYKRLMDIEQKERIKILIEPHEAEIKKEEIVKFSAKVTGDNTYDIKWVVEDEKFGVIDEFGEFHAKDLVGSVKVIAISNVDPTVTANALVTIKETSKMDKAVNLVKI